MQVNTPIQFLSGTKSNKPKLILQKNDNVDYIVCESNEGCWGNGICDPILNIAKHPRPIFLSFNSKLCK